MADEYGADERTPPSFVLAPQNSAAKRATDHVRNDYRRCPLDEASNTFGLWMDFSDPEIQEITLGCHDTDIHLPEINNSKGSSTSQISDLQASFQIVPATGAVILNDYSAYQNTEPFSPTNGNSAHHGGVTVKFPPGYRSVLVARGINSRIAFGRDRYYQFEIRWHSDGLYSFPKEEPYVVGPRKSKTKKYIQGEKVGGGAYGTVWWAMDITNGSIIAVKKFHNLSGKASEFATREVANMFRINKSNPIHHDHILEIFDSVGGNKGDDWGEILMPLKEGNLKRLVETLDGSDPASIAGIAETVLRQMLLALQCLAAHDIVHRDIKPENILWEYGSAGHYTFCLGDFGLSNDPKVARTVAGTEPFMAPEVFHRQPQSTKVDIWSLFATFVWIKNTGGFRNSCSQYGAQDIHQWLARIAKLPEYTRTKRMASMNPKKRPSAEEQLILLDDELVVYDDTTAAYGDGAEDLGAGFGDQFSKMSLQDSGIGYGPDSTDSVNPPARPYYEPYTTGLYDEENEGGPSREYRPPWHDEAAAPIAHHPKPWEQSPGSDLAEPGYRHASPAGHGKRVAREQPAQAYVAPYGEAYGPFDDPDTDTAGPDMWTAQQPTEVATGHREGGYRERESRRKQKGKHKG